MTTILGLRNEHLTQVLHNDLQRHPSTSGRKSAAFGLGHLSVNDGKKPIFCQSTYEKTGFFHFDPRF
jgi:hypothetical protein